MPWIVPGSEYDIFVSYRQKHKRYDSWVTEFVGKLRKELEATFKEGISVYFDENPHEGLMDTHRADFPFSSQLFLTGLQILFLLNHHVG